MLAEDLAARLGTIAHLVGLRRLAVAPFHSEPMWTFETLQHLSDVEREEVLLPVDAALKDCRRVDLPMAGIGALRQGRSVDVADNFPGTVRIYSPGHEFLGLGRIDPPGLLVPLRLISSKEPIPA